jgi:hypothetical protein
MRQACSSMNLDAAENRPDWFPLTPSQNENHVATDSQCVLVPDSCCCILVGSPL